MEQSLVLVQICQVAHCEEHRERELLFLCIGQVPLESTPPVEIHNSPFINNEQLHKFIRSNVVNMMQCLKHVLFSEHIQDPLAIASVLSEQTLLHKGTEELVTL